MTTSLTWPRTTLVPTAVALNMRPNNTSGGVGFGGSEQIIGNTPGRWVLSYQNIDVRSRDAILAWNKTAGQLRGRLNPIMLPLYDRQREPTPTPSVTITGNPQPGDVSVVLTVASGGAPEAGMHWMNPLKERMYRITSIDDVVGNVYTCTVWPPLRERLLDGYIAQFDDIYFRCRLAADNGMDMQLDLLKFGSPSVDWVEDV